MARINGRRKNPTKSARAQNARSNGATVSGTRVHVTAPTFLDLFCGCGGFTLGMLQSGFRCLAAIDVDPTAIATLKTNLVANHGQEHPPPENVLERDLQRFAAHELAALIGTDRVDVIVGGPPCQGFSIARQRDGSNHGARLKDDPRRHLYREFLRYVDFFQPRVFVMENVLGLRNAAGGQYFTAVQKEARELGRDRGCLGYRVHSQIEDGWELGVPQKRRRQLLVGVRADQPAYFHPELGPSPRAVPRITLGSAIGDLPIVRAGAGDDEREYDRTRRTKHLRTYGKASRAYLFRVLEVHRAMHLTNHTARPHSERDLRDFRLLREGQNSKEAMRKGVKFEFPYDKSVFKDRYTRQSRTEPCSTIVAHLSKDGLMFIHPTQNRSLTPREAARIQSFPDWFRFPASRTHAFRLIGNAVPPLVAEAVGFAIRHFFDAVQSASALSRDRNDYKKRNDRTPADRVLQSSNALAGLDATRDLERLAKLGNRALRALPKPEFLRGWHAILQLFPDLHPYNALDHGATAHECSECKIVLPGLEPHQWQRHARSGWPVALTAIGREAWRRHDAGQLTKNELYRANAIAASFVSRQAVLA